MLGEEDKMSGFIRFTETDYGSKRRAKKATEEYSKRLTMEGKWRLKAWWYEVLGTAQMLCLAYAFDTGTLWESIRIEEGRPMPEGYPYEVAFASQNEMINSMIIAGGIGINPKTGRVCDYAQAVHDGHFSRSGAWIPEKPFLREAIERHMAELDKILDTCIKKVGREVWAGE